ncbi:hypothetical protein SNEBB_009194 [Seison nebaliae]|nr:hypothetical protein SNEBB_009194 [Seison nebaliae]
MNETKKKVIGSYRPSTASISFDKKSIKSNNINPKKQIIVLQRSNSAIKTLKYNGTRKLFSQPHANRTPSSKQRPKIENNSQREGHLQPISLKHDAKVHTRLSSINNSPTRLKTRNKPTKNTSQIESYLKLSRSTACFSKTRLPSAPNRISSLRKRPITSKPSNCSMSQVSQGTNYVRNKAMPIIVNKVSNRIKIQSTPSSNSLQLRTNKTNKISPQLSHRLKTAIIKKEEIISNSALNSDSETDSIEFDSDKDDPPSKSSSSLSLSSLSHSSSSNTRTSVLSSSFDTSNSVSFDQFQTTVAPQDVDQKLNHADLLALEQQLTRSTETTSMSKLKEVGDGDSEDYEKEMCEPTYHRSDLFHMSSKLSISVDTSRARSTIDALRLCIHRLGWREYPFGIKDNECDIYWNAATFHENTDIKKGIVNKFPGMHELLRKTDLTRSLQRMQQIFPEVYDFFPKSWLLPEQLKDFEDYSQNSGGNKKVFIVKPSDGAQGDGIYLIKKSGELKEPITSLVVQEYIQNPFLLDDLKFDFRIYVLIASIHPLEMYVCDEGLTRFCTKPYEEANGTNLAQYYLHLTNYAINKYSSTYRQWTNESSGGTKQLFSSVIKRIEYAGGDVESLKCQINDLVVKTIFAVLPALKVEYASEIILGQKNSKGKKVVGNKKNQLSCFQILGFDILLMSDLKPILLEVNSSPSLRIDYEKKMPNGDTIAMPSQIDERIKQPLILDTLRLVAPREKMMKMLRYQEHLYNTDNRIKATERIRKKLDLPKRGLQQVTHEEIIATHHQVSCLKILYKSEVGDEYRNATKFECLFSVFDINNSMYPNFMDATTNVDNHGKFQQLLYETLEQIEYISFIFLRFILNTIPKRMCPKAFRTFIKTCRIIDRDNISSENIDMLYLQVQSKWAEINQTNSNPAIHDRRPNVMNYQTSLPFNGFMEIFQIIAKQKFKKSFELTGKHRRYLLLYCIDQLMNHCFRHMQTSDSSNGIIIRRSKSSVKSQNYTNNNQRDSKTNKEMGHIADLRKSTFPILLSFT